MSKTIVITGASDGIGAAAARRLHQDGHRVVIIGRSERKTQAIARGIGADYFVVDFRAGATFRYGKLVERSDGDTDVQAVA